MAVKKTTKAKKTGTMPRKNAVTKKPAGNVTKGKKNKFAGAKSIQLTENSIAVTRVESKNERGKYQKTETRRYYPQTRENMLELSQAISGREMKKATFEYK